MDIQRSGEGRMDERGSAILTVTVVLTVLMVLLLVFLNLVGRMQAEHEQVRDGQQLVYVAEAGLGEAFLELEQERAPTIASPDEPAEFSGAQYFVESQDLGMRVQALRATAFDARGRERLELIVREIPDGFFRYAVFGDEGVLFDPSSFVDSYDSSLGSYADQYDTEAGHASEFGNVGSNVDIALRTNTEIYGSASPGPEHVVQHLGPNTLVSGSTEPAEGLVPLPPIEVPVIASAGSANVKGTTLRLGPGDVHYSSVAVSSGGAIEIRGPARVVFDDLSMAANTTLTMLTTGGPVEIYGTGNFRLQSNSQLVTHTSRPHDAAIYLSGNNLDGRPRAAIEFNANADYTGLIYAPSARIEIQTMFQIYGSVMARQVALGSNSAIHYDVSLLFDDDNGPPEFEKISWRPIGLE